MFLPLYLWIVIGAVFALFALVGLGSCVLRARKTHRVGTHTSSHAVSPSLVTGGVGGRLDEDEDEDENGGGDRDGDKGEGVPRLPKSLGLEKNNTRAELRTTRATPRQDVESGLELHDLPERLGEEDEDDEAGERVGKEADDDGRDESGAHGGGEEEEGEGEDEAAGGQSGDGDGDGDSDHAPLPRANSKKDRVAAVAAGLSALATGGAKVVRVSDAVVRVGANLDDDDDDDGDDGEGQGKPRKEGREDGDGDGDGDGEGEGEDDRDEVGELPQGAVDFPLRAHTGPAARSFLFTPGSEGGSGAGSGAGSGEDDGSAVSSGSQRRPVWWVDNHFDKPPSRARSGPAPSLLGSRARRKSSPGGGLSLVGGLPIEWLRDTKRDSFSDKSAAEAAELAAAEAGHRANKLSVSKAEKKMRRALSRNTSGKKEMQQARRERQASLIYKNLDRLLQHVEGRSAFVQHLERRFCTESLMFHRAAKASLLRLEEGDPMPVDTVLRLYDTYVRDGAQLMINIRSDSKDRIARLVDELVASERRRQQAEAANEPAPRPDVSHVAAPRVVSIVPDALAARILAAFRQADAEMVDLMERSLLPEFLRSEDSLGWKDTCRRAVEEYAKMQQQSAKPRRRVLARRPSF